MQVIPSGAKKRVVAVLKGAGIYSEVLSCEELTGVIPLFIVGVDEPSLLKKLREDLLGGFVPIGPPLVFRGKRYKPIVIGSNVPDYVILHEALHYVHPTWSEENVYQVENVLWEKYTGGGS